VKKMSSREDRQLSEYVVEVTRDEKTGDFVLRVPRLPGLIAVGSTLDEAMAELEFFYEEWVADSLEHGETLPQPRDKEFSGKLLLRMAPSLHARAANMAEQEGVSLNTYVVTALAETLGSAAASGADSLLASIRMIAESQTQMAGEVVRAIDVLGSEVTKLSVDVAKSLSAVKTELADTRSAVAAQTFVQLGYAESPSTVVMRAANSWETRSNQLEAVYGPEVLPGYPASHFPVTKRGAGT
jgi:predicted HicB family RNase H-like nuclease